MTHTSAHPTPNVRVRYPHLWPVGAGGLVATQRVVAVGRWSSAPIRRAARAARAENRLIDLTCGEACRWVIFLDTGQVALATEPAPVSVIDDDSFDQYLIQRYGEEQP